MPSQKLAVIFANLKSNIGDFAILHSVLRDLRSAYPDAQIDVFPHANYAIDAARLEAFRRDCGFDVRISGETFWKPVPMTPLRRLRKAMRLWPSLQNALIEELATSSAAAASKFAPYDGVYTAGGEHWGGTQGGVSMFGTLLAVSRVNPNVFAYPFSLNRRVLAFNTRQKLHSYFSMLQRPLIARDQESAAFLVELGLDAVAGADCVFSMHDIADRISPSPQSRRVILSITGSSGSQQSELRQSLGALPPSLRPALMTTCESEDGALYQSLASEFGLEYLAPDSWMSAVGALKACDLLITNRLHGLIFATLAGTAVIPVTDRRKSKAFARDSQVPVTASSGGALTTELIGAGLQQAESIRERLATYKANALLLRRTPLPTLQESYANRAALS
jgi:polysaccharide pyruvyl transferase WcaK-like protein